MEPAEGGGTQPAKEPPGERLRAALCDLELQNTVVGLLATCQLGGGGILVPLHLLTKAPAAAAQEEQQQLVPAVVRGRTPAELLLECPGGRRLVAMHFKLLLAHCTLDQLLLLAAKVQARMMQRTPSLMVATPTKPVNKALLRLERAAAAAASAARSTLASPSPAPSLPCPPACRAVTISPQVVPPPRPTTVGYPTPGKAAAASRSSSSLPHLAAGHERPAAGTRQHSPQQLGTHNAQQPHRGQLTGSPGSENEPAPRIVTSTGSTEGHRRSLSPSSRAASGSLPPAAGSGNGGGSSLQTTLAFGLQPTSASVHASPFHAAAAGSSEQGLPRGSPPTNGQHSVPTATNMARQASLHPAPSGWDFSCLSLATAPAGLMSSSPFASYAGTGSVAAWGSGGLDSALDTGSASAPPAPGWGGPRHSPARRLPPVAPLAAAPDHAGAVQLQRPASASATTAASRAAARVEVERFLELLGEAVPHLEAGLAKLQGPRGGQSLVYASVLCHLSNAIQLQEGVAAFLESL